MVTHADLILMTLYRLSDNGCDIDLVSAGVDVARLTVEAWRANPAALGLAGYDHPDSRRVHNAMYGKKGLMSQGWVERVGRWRDDHRVRLTAAGIERAGSIYERTR